MQATCTTIAYADETFTLEGCHIRESWNHRDDPALSIARARVEPGQTTEWHWLDGVAERYVVVSGIGVVELGELEAMPVSPGDLVLIPPGMAQRISNSGAEDLVFDCLCTPRFTPECYHSGKP